MDTNKILEDVLKINNISSKDILSQNQINNLQKEYFDLYDIYPAIFKMACNGNMDIERLKYMLQMLDNIKNDSMTEHDASVNVGQKLVDEIVKPNLEKKK